MGLLAIAFSDLHAYKFKSHDVDGSRLKLTLNALAEIILVAKNAGVPLLFAGDLYHTPKDLESETLVTMQCVLAGALMGKQMLYAISGNHDQNEKNGWNYRSNSYLKGHWATQPGFVLLDYLDGAVLPGNTLIQGVPYMNSEDEIKEAVDHYRPIAKKHQGFKILLMHGDVLGAKDSNGLELYEGKLFKNGVDNFFKEWDLILYGHIHLPQKISHKVYMLGSPIQQISSDKGDRGYWEIYNDRDPIFVGLANYPKFIQLAEKEVAPPGGKDYYIPFEREESIADVEKGDFNMNVSRTRMAKRYMKAKGIKDKVKRKELIHILNSIE